MSMMIVNNVGITGVLAFKTQVVTAASLDAEGVLSIDIDAMTSGADLLIDHGVVLHGIRLISNGLPFMTDDDTTVLLMIKSVGACQLIHNSGSVSNSSEKFSVSSGNNVFVDSRRIQIFWSTGSGSRVWEVPDWSV